MNLPAMEVLLPRLAALAAPVFIGVALLWIVVRRWREERAGWLELPFIMARGGRWLVRAGWLVAVLATLVLLFLWPAHPVADVVAGPDRAQGVVRMYNAAQYLAWWQTYANYGTIAEPLLLWLWAVWLAVSAVLRLLFGLTAGS